MQDGSSIFGIRFWDLVISDWNPSKTRSARPQIISKTPALVAPRMRSRIFCVPACSRHAMCTSLIGWWFLISQSQKSKCCDDCKPAHQNPATLPCCILKILFEVQRFEFWTDFRYNGMRGNLWVSACLVHDLKPVQWEFFSEIGLVLERSEIKLSNLVFLFVCRGECPTHGLKLRLTGRQCDQKLRTGD